MSVPELVLEYLKVLVWPILTLVLLILYREAILAVIPRSKIKVTLFGVTIETTLSELENVTLANLGGHLDNRQHQMLAGIAKDGPKPFENGIPKDQRLWIRPLMNAGLVMTLPEGAHLGKAEGLALTPLGNLVMRSNK